MKQKGHGAKAMPASTEKGRLKRMSFRLLYCTEDRNTKKDAVVLIKLLKSYSRRHHKLNARRVRLKQNSRNVNY